MIGRDLDLSLGWDLWELHCNLNYLGPWTMRITRDWFSHQHRQTTQNNLTTTQIALVKCDCNQNDSFYSFFLLVLYYASYYRMVLSLPINYVYNIITKKH